MLILIQKEQGVPIKIVLDMSKFFTIQVFSWISKLTVDTKRRTALLDPNGLVVIVL